MSNSLNLIIKDYCNNDNLINICKENNLYEFTCTCGKKYCHHLDYVIHRISSDFNQLYQKDDYFQIIGYSNYEYLKIDITNTTNNNIYEIIINFENNVFNVKSEIFSNNCFYSKYAVIDLISNYLKQKENHISNDNEDNLINIQKKLLKLNI